MSKEWEFIGSNALESYETETKEQRKRRAAKMSSYVSHMKVVKPKKFKPSRVKETDE